MRGLCAHACACMHVQVHVLQRACVAHVYKYIIHINVYICIYINRYTLYCQGQPHDGRAAYASVAMLDLHAQRGARAACMVLMMRVEAVGRGHRQVRGYTQLQHQHVGRDVCTHACFFSVCLCMMGSTRFNHKCSALLIAICSADVCIY